MSSLRRVLFIFLSFVVAIAIAGCDTNSPISGQQESPPSNARALHSQSSLNVSVYRAAPENTITQSDYIWIADVSGVDEEDCSFQWALERPDGFTMVIFRQNFYTASEYIATSGSYVLSATADCPSGSGTGQLSFYAIGSNPEPTIAPPSGETSGMPVATEDDSSTPSPDTGVCTIWAAFDYEEWGEPGQYYRFYNEYCPGGPKREPMFTSS